MLLMKRWMGLFFPSVTFSRGEQIVDFIAFLFPVIAVFCRSMIICFACCWCRVWGNSSSSGAVLFGLQCDCQIPYLAFCPHLPQLRNDRMWWYEEILRLPTAVFMLTLTWALISSHPPPQHTYHGEVSVTSLNWMKRGLACMPEPHFTASLNPWPSMIAFKAVKPQRLSSLSASSSMCAV